MIAIKLKIEVRELKLKWSQAKAPIASGVVVSAGWFGKE